MLKQLPYLGWWYARSLMGRKAPLQSVIFLLDSCNLRCKHCSVYATATPHIKDMEQLRAELEECYKAGSRFVDFEGGELYLWKDGDKTIDDVIDMAHEMGFWSATITTNAQIPFTGSHADQVWVSMDGIGSVHDQIRGHGVFARLEKNIKAFREGGAKTPLCVNMVINNVNYTNVAEAIQYVKDSPYINQISLNFHTPFEATEGLFLDPEKRNEVIDMIIGYKRRGYPIMNSVSGLKAMRMVDGKTLCTNRWCWVTNFIFADGTRSPKCAGSLYEGVCDRCGFSMGGEMRSVFHLSPDTIFAGLKLRT